MSKKIKLTNFFICPLCRSPMEKAKLPEKFSCPKCGINYRKESMGRIVVDMQIDQIKKMEDTNNE